MLTKMNHIRFLVDPSMGGGLEAKAVNHDFCVRVSHPDALQAAICDAIRRSSTADNLPVAVSLEMTHEEVFIVRAA